MFTDIEQVIKWLHDNRIRNFCVYQSGKENSDRGNRQLLNCTFEDETEEAKERKLRDCLEAFGSGDFVIKQVDGNSKNAECILRIRQNSTSAQIGGFGPSVGYTEKEVNALLAQQRAEFEKERTEERFKRLEEELKEARKEASENGGAMSEFVKNITPFVQPVLSGLLGRRTQQIGMLDQQPQAQQMQPQQEEQTEDMDLTDEEFKKLCQALREWKEADPDYLQIIFAIPQFAKTNPMYGTAKNFILNN